MIKQHIFSILAVFGAVSFALTPAIAQIDSVDPDLAIQSYEDEPVDDETYSGTGSTTESPAYGEEFDSRAATETDTTVVADPGYIPPDTPGNESLPAAEPATGDTVPGAAANDDFATGTTNPVAPPGEPGTTYQQDDLIAAAGGVFGDGAEGIARIIEDILADQGEPNGYIVGREAGGAFIFGLRYGSGTLFHKVEGEHPVYWTGPSVGFDFGANGASTFVLVYNLYDTEELYRRFPAVEGDAYFIGGLTASYLRSGDKVLIPIRLGAGLRLGANLGYMNFSRDRRWLPF